MSDFDRMAVGMAELLKFDKQRMCDLDIVQTAFFQTLVTTCPSRLNVASYIAAAYRLIQSVRASGFDWSLGPWLIIRGRQQHIDGHRRIGLMLACGVDPMVRVWRPRERKQRNEQLLTKR